jgi:hypothetical protein
MCFSLGGEGYKACKAVYKYLAPLTPGTSENISAHPELYETRVPNAPCVYVEVDFHDVPNVAKWLVENTEAIGEAICKGICDHFGVKYVEPMNVTTSDNANTVYRIQVAAYRDKANAEAMLAKLKEAGFEGFITTENKVTEPVKTIEEGSLVRVAKGAKDYNGVSLASFVYDRNHTVYSISGDRVVIDYNGVIVAAVHKDNLILL